MVGLRVVCHCCFPWAKAVGRHPQEGPHVEGEDPGLPFGAEEEEGDWLPGRSGCDAAVPSGAAGTTRRQGSLYAPPQT